MTVDEELRDGLGLCADVCPEITIQIIDRRAISVSDIYRDGPGACVGGRPRGAVSAEERGQYAQVDGGGHE